MDQQILLSADMPDAALIVKILHGEKRMFEWVIRRYNQRLYRIGMSILGNDADAEEAMQSAYVRAYEHLGQFEGRSSFGTWLTRIMINESMAQKNKRHRTEAANQRTEKDAGSRTPDQILINRELSDILENAIAALPEIYRLVFVLREVEGMSVRDAGEALGIGEPNVKVRLNRAKTMLRQTLSGYMKDQVFHFHLTRCDLMVKNVFARLD